MRKISTRKLYCARGDMENRIKEQKLDLFADRTSCHKWWPNQFRLLLSSLAYALVETIRRLGAGRHRDGPRPGRHHPSQALEDRRRHCAQHAARALPTLQRLPGQGPVHAGCRPARPRIAVKKRVQSRPESRRRAFQHRRSPENRPCPPKRPRRPAGARRPRPTPPTAAPRRRFTPSHNRKSASLPLHEISALAERSLHFTQAFAIIKAIRFGDEHNSRTTTRRTRGVRLTSHDIPCKLAMQLGHANWAGLIAGADKDIGGHGRP